MLNTMISCLGFRSLRPRFNHWSSIIDFGNGPTQAVTSLISSSRRRFCCPELQENIVIANQGRLNSLVFELYRWPKSWPAVWLVSFRFVFFVPKFMMVFHGCCHVFFHPSSLIRTSRAQGRPPLCGGVSGGVEPPPDLHVPTAGMYQTI